jgi:hypothetical protein
MIVTNIILACLMTVTIGIAALWTYRSRRSYKLNSIIATELDGIIGKTLDVVKKNKELAQQQRVSALYTKAAAGDTPDLDSPELLSTIVTILVSKYGDVKLSPKDFLIEDNEYVSVYIDTATQEIILSMNHGLGKEASYPLINYGSKDDNTFH